MRRVIAAAVERVTDALEPVAKQLVLRDLVIRIEVDPINVRVRVLDTRRRKGGG